MAHDARRPFLDRPSARVLAALVFIGCMGTLAWLERERLWTVASSVSGAEDPFARCFAERAAAIDRMQAEGTIQAAQAELFKTRAEAMCRGMMTEGPGAGAPPLPSR